MDLESTYKNDFAVIEAELNGAKERADGLQEELDILLEDYNEQSLKYEEANIAMQRF